MILAPEMIYIPQRLGEVEVMVYITKVGRLSYTDKALQTEFAVTYTAPLKNVEVIENFDEMTQIPDAYKTNTVRLSLQDNPLTQSRALRTANYSTSGGPQINIDKSVFAEAIENNAKTLAIDINHSGNHAHGVRFLYRGTGVTTPYFILEKDTIHTLFIDMENMQNPDFYEFRIEVDNKNDGRSTQEPNFHYFIDNIRVATPIVEWSKGTTQTFEFENDAVAFVKNVIEKDMQVDQVIFKVYDENGLVTDGVTQTGFTLRVISDLTVENIFISNDKEVYTFSYTLSVVDKKAVVHNFNGSGLGHVFKASDAWGSTAGSSVSVAQPHPHPSNGTRALKVTRADAGLKIEMNIPVSVLQTAITTYGGNRISFEVYNHGNNSHPVSFIGATQLGTWGELASKEMREFVIDADSITASSGFVKLCFDNDVNSETDLVWYLDNILIYYEAE